MLFARPHQPDTAAVSSGGRTIYKGLPGWKARIAWYLNALDQEIDCTEPLQWRTATGICRCVRCGLRIDQVPRPYLVHGCMIACTKCVLEVEPALAVRLSEAETEGEA